MEAKNYPKSLDILSESGSDEKTIKGPRGDNRLLFPAIDIMPEFEERIGRGMNETGSFRTIWVSDLHLGTRSSQAERFLEFLRSTESDYLYLVGDIVDGWALRRSWYWPQAHNDVIQKLLRKARKGTQVIYIPGNHDEFARHFLEQRLGEIEIHGRKIHHAADGRRVLVLHGHEFDGLVSRAQWLMKLGARAYDWVLNLNRWLRPVFVKMGRSHWSLSQYAKLKSKQAVQFIGDFENIVAREAELYDVDAVVCGHIHKPEMRQLRSILYANSGDWVENCTFLVEHHDGRLELLDAGTKSVSEMPGFESENRLKSTIGLSWVCHLQE